MFFSLPSIPSLPFTKTSQVRWQGQSPKIQVHSICHYRRLAAKSFFQWQPGSIMIHPAILSSPHKLNGLIPWGGGSLGVGLRFWWKSAIRNLDFETDQVNWNWFRTQILLLQKAWQFYVAPGPDSTSRTVKECPLPELSVPNHRAYADA